MKRREFVTAAAATGGVSALAGCLPDYGWGTKEFKWRETVTLSSGEQVKIARHLVYGVTGSAGGERSAIQWKSALLKSDETPEQFPPWDAPLFAMLLERDATGAFFLVATTDSSFTWRDNGEPPWGYWGFVVKDRRWRLAPVPQEFFGRWANLLVDTRDDDTSQNIEEQLEARKAREGGQYVFPAIGQIQQLQRYGFEPSAQVVPPIMDLKEFLE